MSDEIQGTGLRGLFDDAKKSQVRIRNNPANYYPKILVSKAKRATLYIGFTIVLCVVTAVIYQEILEGSDWKEMILPVVTFSSLLIFLPISEQWAYRPWQGASRQLEREVRE